MANPKPLQLPGPEYSGGEESLFRRKLENQLLDLETRLEQSERRDGTVSSLASKRARYTGVGLGESLYGAAAATGTVTTSGTPVDNDYAKFTDANTIEGRSYSEVRGDLYPESYLTAHRSFAANAGRYYTIGSVVAEDWEEDSDASITLDTWVKDQQDGTPEWDDSAVDGEFVYGGTATRKFMITWSLNMRYYLRNNYTSLMGGIFLKPDGGSWSATPVAGSSQVSNYGWDYIFSVYWVYAQAISGGAIVEVANGDTIRFQYGWKIYLGTNTGSLVVAYQSGGTTVDGMTINIVPVT